MPSDQTAGFKIIIAMAELQDRPRNGPIAVYPTKTSIHITVHTSPSRFSHPITPVHRPGLLHADAVEGQDLLLLLGPNLDDWSSWRNEPLRSDDVTPCEERHCSVVYTLFF